MTQARLIQVREKDNIMQMRRLPNRLLRFAKAAS
jgi:hypothetical protein